jgi:hypothetical protein
LRKKTLGPELSWVKIQKPPSPKIEMGLKIQVDDGTECERISMRLRNSLT